MKGRGVLISISIIIGLVLACAILPLGGFALLLMLGNGDTASTPMPAMTWQEQVISGGQGGFVGDNDRLLVLNISGVIGAEDVGLGATQLTQRELLSQIDQATQDEQVKAVVVRINSPGGGVVASREIHAALTELREAGKTLVVSMGSMAASGGYYVATPADSIYANADTFTGSLGVIITLLGYEETFDIVGLEQRIFKSGEFKDIGSPVRDITPQEEKILQDIIDQAYQGFVDVIVEGRSLPRERVVELADGRIYTGKQALDVGLVDALGNRDDAIAAAKEMAGLPGDALVVQYNTTPDLLELFSGFMANNQQRDPLGLKTLTEPQPPRLEYRFVR
jgi:protease-4